MGYRTIIARYVAKWGIAQVCMCETKRHWDVSHHFGGVQKHPDVHKIVLSIKLRLPLPGKSVNLEDFLPICTVFPHFGPFWGGGG